MCNSVLSADVLSVYLEGYTGTIVQLRCYQAMYQCLVSFCPNVLSDITNIPNMIVAGTRYCIYLANHNQGCNNIRTQFLKDATCYMESLLTVSGESSSFIEGTAYVYDLCPTNNKGESSGDHY